MLLLFIIGRKNLWNQLKALMSRRESTLLADKNSKKKLSQLIVINSRNLSSAYFLTSVLILDYHQKKFELIHEASV
jgi:hypothetical protein